MRFSTKQEGLFAAFTVVAIVIASFFSTLFGVLIAVTALTLFAINEFKKEMKGGSFGLGAANEARQQEKSRNREKLMEYLETHERITNDEVERLLNVSHATATRYLDELQEDGLVNEVGEGAGTHYRKP